MTTELIVKKILGWILVLVGIIMIAYTIIGAMNYFSGVTPFPELFFSETKEIAKTGGSSDALNDIMQDMLSGQINSLIPEGSITNLLNMSAWSIFAFFMVFAGAKLFELGLKIMKE